MPSPSAPDDTIAPFWADLDLSVGGEVYVASGGYNGQTIIQYDNVRLRGQPDTRLTFQVVLDLDDSEYWDGHTIEFRYADLLPGSPAVGAIGIQGRRFEAAGGDRVDGLGMAFNEHLAQSHTTSW